MKTLSRRAVLKGARRHRGAALPRRDGAGAARVGRRDAATQTRLVCVEMVHGAAGSSAIGIKKNLWAPAAVGRDFDLAPTSLRSLEPFRDHLTIVSNTDVDPANPFTAKEIGGDHFRSSAVFLTQAHPKQTQGGDVAGGRLARSALRAAVRAGHADPVDAAVHRERRPGRRLRQRLLLRLHRRDQLGGRRPAAADDPRSARRLRQAVRRAQGRRDARRSARERLAEDRSILDWLLSSVARLQKTLGPADRARLADYLDHVREIERRIQIVEARNRSGELRELPAAPVGVPDSFSEHVKLMFDLQVLAFASDITRVFAFKLGRDDSNRSYPESGFKGAFHDTSHHSGREDKILNFAKLNTYHVGLMPYLLEQLKSTPDGDGTLLDRTLLIYGSPMGDSNLHNHKRVPFFIAGRAGGAIEGRRAPEGAQRDAAGQRDARACCTRWGSTTSSASATATAAYNIGHGQHD